MDRTSRESSWPASRSATCDLHAAVRKLQDADLSERQAETLVEVFSPVIGEPATKVDLYALGAELRADFKAELAAVEARLTWRIVLALGAFAALVRLIP